MRKNRLINNLLAGATRLLAVLGGCASVSGILACCGKMIPRCPADVTHCETDPRTSIKVNEKLTVRTWTREPTDDYDVVLMQYTSQANGGVIKLGEFRDDGLGGDAKAGDGVWYFEMTWTDGSALTVDLVVETEAKNASVYPRYGISGDDITLSVLPSDGDAAHSQLQAIDNHDQEPAQ